jgi:hypothetical protein
MYNHLIDEIRRTAKSKPFRDRQHARNQNSRRGYENCKKYIDELRARYAKLLVLRVDFAYLKEEISGICLDRACADLERFLRNRRNNRLFDDMVGYVWKLEYGVERHYHFHLLFFYDGNRVKNDQYRAAQIGEYWKKLTEGRGAYHSCNDDKSRYINCGIGSLGHADSEKYANLLIAVEYLFKKEQYLRLKVTGKQRTLGIGQLRPVSEAGRKRLRNV